MNAEYAESHKISYTDCDASGRWRPSAIQVKMQEIGEVHAGTYALAREDLIKSGMCWVLYRQQVVMHEYPVFSDDVVIKTWPGTVQGPVFPRFFSFERPNGTRIGKAVTGCVLMDIHTRRPLRPSAAPAQAPEDPNPTPLMPLPSMLRIENAQPLTRRTVCYSDLDINGHMNNTRYIDWVCDTLDLPSLNAAGLSGWQINFISEAKPGETLELLRAQDADGGMLTQGKRLSDGRTVFEARTSLNES